MAKYFGAIGYGTTETDDTGVSIVKIREREYYGDVTRNARRYQAGENLNDDLVINNEFRILADPYAMDHFFEIRYVTWMGARWKVTNVEVQHPRLVLTAGGVYNGEGPED